MSNKNRIQHALNVRSGEWGQLAAFFFLIVLNMIALESADVVATSGYMEQPGMNHLPILWIVDMIIILISSGLYALISDRFPRRNLLQGLMIGFGLSLLLCRWLLTFGAPNAVYTLLYILVDQQMILFPLSFWAFANDKYNVASSKRLFPIVSAGGLIGNVFGNWFAGRSAVLFSQWGLSNDDLLFVCSLAFFAAWLILLFAFKKDPAKVKQHQGAQGFDFRETWNTGKDFVKNIPLFRYLLFALFFSEIVMTFVEFHFLARTTEQFTDPVQFQAFYGSYKALLTMIALPLQLFIASRLLERIGLKNAFFAFPSVLCIGSLMAAIFPGFISAVGASFSSRITLNAFESPARKSVQGLIPDAKRGRVSTFLDSYVYAIGTIVGCLLLETFIILLRNKIINATTTIILYEGLGTLIALVTLFFVFRLRKTYDESLWHPTLARRKRRGVASDLLGDL